MISIDHSVLIGFLIFVAVLLKITESIFKSRLNRIILEKERLELERNEQIKNIEKNIEEIKNSLAIKTVS